MKVTNYDDREKMCRAILNRFDIKGDEDMLIRRMRLAISGSCSRMILTMAIRLTY